MRSIPWIKRLPGWIAFSIMAVVTAFWTYWSMGEMFHEGWFGAWYNRLPYLIPAAGFILLLVISITWPRVGGIIVILAGTAFMLFFMNFEVTNGRLTVDWDWVRFFLSGSLIFVGALFVLEGRFRRWKNDQGIPPADRWWHRNLWYLLGLGIPLLIVIGFSAAMLPVVLTRVDDGDRSARRIQGNGVDLVWAPLGPGWNWQQDFGGYPSWNRIALYGMEPIGVEDKPGYGRQADDSYVYATQADMQAYNLCRYLSEDGLSLMDEPQDIWRMPTVDEIVRSLVHHGDNAGCPWVSGETGQSNCDQRPDKESPLWSTDHAPIYYWAYEEYDWREAYFVSFNGYVNATTKSSGNPRHSHRCVREP